VQFGEQGTQYANPGNPVLTPTVNNPTIFSAGVFYNNGPIQLGVGYTGNNGVRGRQALPLSDQCVAATPTGTGCFGDKLKDYAFSVAGAYSFTIVRIGAVYERLKYDSALPSGGDLTRNFWGASLTGNLGPGQAYAFYGWAGNGSGGAADGYRVAGTVKGSETKAQQWELSYTYPLSKRSLLYAGYVKINNKDHAQYNFNINPYNPISSSDSAYATPGGKPQGFVLGMVHFF
jgi:predicted porin